LSFGSQVYASIPQLWRFKPDNKGGGVWGIEPSSSDFASLVQPAGGLQTSGNGVGFYLGGHLSNFTYPHTSPPSSWFRPVQGLTTFNMTSNVWQNVSAVGYNQFQTAHQGHAQFVPGVGANGIVVFFGGQNSQPDVWTENEPLVPMSDIAIFDSTAQKWYHQTATGQVPEPRTRACVVGVQGDKGTYEMFVLGLLSEFVS
jgi:hypothetical protein